MGTNPNNCDLGTNDPYWIKQYEQLPVKASKGKGRLSFNHHLHQLALTHSYQECLDDLGWISAPM